MKILINIVCFLLLSTTLQAQQTATVGKGEAAKSLLWAATPLDSQSTEHRANETVTNSAGEVTTKVHRYVEVGNGLNHLDQWGQLRQSQDLIELMPDGTAASLHAPLKVWFSPNLNNSAGAITMLTSSNRVVKTTPLGLYYFDAASGKSAQISAIQDSLAELHPPNVIVYKSALSCGDVRVTCTKGALEVDLILTKRPKPPEAYGMKSETTRMEFWHSFNGDLSTPARKARVLASDPTAKAEPDLVDEFLDFGDLAYPQGVAFLPGNAIENRGTNVPALIHVPTHSRDGGLVVGKRWMMIDNVQVLIESVRWRDLQPLLKDMPLMAQGPKNTKSKSRLMAKRQLPPARMAKRQIPGPIKVASVAYKPSGLIWDYITVSGAGTDYTFDSSQTYYISSSSSFSGTVTFNPNCTIKYAPGIYLLLYGTVTCPTDTNNPPSIILTSRDEDLFGETLPASTHIPSYSQYPIEFYYTSGSINAMRIRWAASGVRVDGFYNGVINHCAFEICQVGVDVPDGWGYVTDSTQCGVGSPFSGNVSGELTDVCSGDSDSDGLPDVWEIQYFGDLSHGASEDYDGDGITNLQEYQALTDPTRQDTDGDHVIDQQFKVTITHPRTNSNLP